MESMDFEMYAFQRINNLKTGDFPDYFRVVFDAYEREFGISEHDIQHKKFELDIMIRKLCDRYIEDPEKDHLREVMRLKLENDLGV